MPWNRSFLLAAVVGATACSIPTEQPNIPDPRLRIVFDQDSIDVIPGWEASLNAVIVDEADRTVGIPLVWESSDSSVAKPLQGGRVRGGRVGRATLTARTGVVSGSVAAVVRPRGGVLTLAGNSLFDLALDGSPEAVWPVQPTRLPNQRVFAGFESGFDWSGTGRLLYACGDNSVCLVAPGGATEVVTVSSNRLSGGASWWSDGRRIVVGGQSGAQIFDPDTRRVDTIPLPGSPISIRVAPNGTSLAFVTYDDWEGEIAWVKEATGIRRIPGICSDADWSPDGTRLAAVCGDRIYLERNGRPENGFSLSALARQVRWDPSGDFLAILKWGGDLNLTLSNPDGTWQIFWTSASQIPSVETSGVWNLAWRRP